MPAVDVSEVTNAILTTAELFADGSAIDQLRDNLLVYWRDGNETVGPVVEHSGSLYAAMPLDLTLERMLQLPSGSEDCGGVQELITKLEQVTNDYLELDERTKLLIAAAVTETWVSDCLRGSLVINPWGPAGAGNTLIELLSCVCRRPLILVTPSVRELSRLPQTLSPTLILRSADRRTLGPLLAATSEPGAAVLQDGKLIKLSCAIIAYTHEPLGLPACSIPVCATGTSRRLTASERQALIDYFPPRLLAYRLRQHRQVTESQFAAPNFAPETRVLAEALGAAVEGAPGIQARILSALTEMDEQRMVDQSQILAAVVLEALLVACHEHKGAIYVNDVTKLANGILLGRQQDAELFPKRVGGILRGELGLSSARRSPGYEVVLDSHARERIHRLAVAYGTLSTLHPFPTCRFCDELPNRREEHTTSDDNDEARNVHDVQEDTGLPRVGEQ